MFLNICPSAYYKINELVSVETNGIYKMDGEKIKVQLYVGKYELTVSIDIYHSLLDGTSGVVYV